MKKPVLTLLIISIVNCCTYAQTITPQVLNVCGGTWHQGYYSLDWSVGELALVDPMQTADGSYMVSHGFIQPYTDHAGTIIYTTTFTDDEIKILPNPTHDILEVNYLSLTRGPVMFSLYDAKGQALYTKQLTSYGIGFINKIDMTRFSEGTYMLSVTAINSGPGVKKKTRAYKIIKLN